MLTVLVRYTKSGREVLIPAKTVEFVPKGSNLGDAEGLIINHNTPEEGGCQLGFSSKDDQDWRDVFVMNGKGATVARYTL